MSIVAGEIVRCKAEVWFNAYGDESYAVTRHDPPRQVAATKRVGNLRFVQFEDVPGAWFWDDGFERAALN